MNNEFKIQIIFQNEFVIAIDKPCGFLSVPSRMGKNDPRPVLGLILQENLNQAIFPVHRLDEETTGIILFAKSSHAQSLLNQSFEKHEVQKTYQALTSFKPDYPKMIGSVFKNLLCRGKKRSFEAPHGKIAETKIDNILNINENLLLWTLSPRTGRSHQLRVQLAMRGFPLVGDQLYGSDLILNTNQYYLPPSSKLEYAIGLRSIMIEFKKNEILRELNLPRSLLVQKW